MPQSLSKVLINTIFSTKNRRPYVKQIAFRGELYSYMGGAAKSLDCQPIRIGGVSDHVHLLTTLSRTVAIAEFVKEVKRVSTAWIQQRSVANRNFRWQSGYGAFSVSESKVPEVSRYIGNQQELHRTVTFQEEFRELLRHQGLSSTSDSCGTESSNSDLLQP